MEFIRFGVVVWGGIQLTNLKILRVTGEIYPNGGGIGLHAHEMSTYQAKMGCKVVVYTAKIDSSEDHEYRDGYEIFRFKPIVKPIGNYIIPNIFLHLIRKRNLFDVVHAHSHLFFLTNLCAMARKIKSPPLVITSHGLVSQTAPYWLNKIYLHTVAKWTFSTADKVICYTDYEKNELTTMGIDPNKVEVIHNGINTDLFTPSKRGSHNMQILWVGRFVKGKGIKYLIDAFDVLIKQYPELRLVMIGSGIEKDKIKEKIHKLQLNNIIMKDFIPNSEMVKVYQNSDVFVLPSLEEGIPRTILEAMACGIPVVCTELPQLVNIVEGCGLLVPVKNSQALAEGISRVVSNRELAQKFGRNGRDKVVENYSWDDTVKKTIQLYEELIQEVKL